MRHKLMPHINDSVAPDGNLIKDNFNLWFGNSQVKAKDGTPLVVFHGSTRGGISSSLSINSFFSSCPNVASTYSEDDSFLSKGDESMVQAMFLKMENPLIVDADGEPWMRISFENQRFTSDDLVRLARRRGHDGVIIKNVEDNVNDEDLPVSDIYVTLGRCAQFKSAIGNNGLYDKTCMDITDLRSDKIMNKVSNAYDALDYVNNQSKAKERHAPQSYK